MIWQRSVAYLMKPAIYDELEIDIQDAGMPNNMDFQTTYKKVKFNGYLAVYGIKNETNDFEKYLTSLKSGKYTLACKELKAKNTWQSPPARYNDSGLVKLMEQEGIGRPSTFSATIEKLTEKMYVMKSDIKGEEQVTTDYTFNPSTKTIKPVKGTTMVGAELSKIRPTDIGIQIDSYLADRFGYIVDKNFTAAMEGELDLVAEGKKKKLTVLNDFWKPFSKDLELQQGKKEEKMKVTTESSEITVNGKQFKLRVGPYGPLAEYDVDGKKTYIGLKGYLGMVRKEYLDIDEEDIKFLMSLPKKMGSVNGKDAMLYNGPYGFYLKYDGNNVRIPRFAIKEFVATKTLTNEQLKGFIQYAKDHPKTESADSSTKKPYTKKTYTRKTKTV